MEMRILYKSNGEKKENRLMTATQLLASSPTCIICSMFATWVSVSCRKSARSSRRNSSSSPVCCMASVQSITSAGIVLVDSMVLVVVECQVPVEVVRCIGEKTVRLVKL